MHAMEELRKTLNKELEKISAKGTINETDLAHIDKLTHSIKSIDTIMAMQDAGYSNRAYPMHYMDNSYDGGNSYGYGRYSRDRMGYSRGDGYSYRRDGDGDGRYYEDRGMNIREKMERLLNEASTETEREAIRRAMSQMN